MLRSLSLKRAILLRPTPHDVVDLPVHGLLSAENVRLARPTLDSCTGRRIHFPRPPPHCTLPRTSHGAEVVFFCVTLNRERSPGFTL